MDDVQIVQNLRSRDPAAIRRAREAMFDKYHKQLLGYVYKQFAQVRGKEDVVQEIFIESWEDIDQLREPSKLRPWLYAIAYRQGLAARKREEGADPLDEDPSASGPGPEEQAGTAVGTATLRQASRCLSKPVQQAYWLLSQGFEGQDLADVMAVSPGYAYKLKERVLKEMPATQATLRLALYGSDLCTGLAGGLRDSGWDGELTPRVRRWVKKHIAVCAGCRERWERYRDSAPVIVPPVPIEYPHPRPQLRRQVLTAAERRLPPGQFPLARSPLPQRLRKLLKRYPPTAVQRSLMGAGPAPVLVIPVAGTALVAGAIVLSLLATPERTASVQAVPTPSPTQTNAPGSAPSASPTSDGTAGSGGALPNHVVSMRVAGSGTGTVISHPSGIACGTACKASFADKTSVSLVATADSGSVFGGWSGGGCTGNGPCAVTMGADQSVTARFDRAPIPTRSLALARSGLGTGTVISDPSGIACGTACKASFADKTSVSLVATADSGSVFGGWSGGGCTGNGPCAVTMGADQSVTARFDKVPIPPRTLAVARAGLGTGTVASNPSGIACGTACKASFADKTSVSLVATADPGSVFGGWSGGGCTGNGPCTVTMGADATVTALFNSFVGAWVNSNPNTNGITHAEIRVDSGRVLVHMWGKCSPTDCDWGETTATASGANDGTLSVRWVFSFAEDNQKLALLPDGRLRVEGFTHFTDSSGRTDFSYTEDFARAASGTPLLPRGGT